MSLEKPRSKKTAKSERVPIELDPKLSSQERWDKLVRLGGDQTHYPVSHVPTRSEYEQGVTRGPTIPPELTPEFVDSLTYEEQQHFLENITVPEVKKGSLEKSKQQLALEYYAANDSEEGVENMNNISINTLSHLQHKDMIKPLSMRKNRITSKGREQLKKYQAEQQLTQLFTQSPGVHGLDRHQSAGYVNTLKVLNAVAQSNNVTTRQVVDQYEIANPLVSHILTISGNSENQLVISKGKGVPDDPRKYTITARGKIFLAEGLKMLADMGENLQLKPRAIEMDGNQEYIDQQQVFRFPLYVSRAREILGYLTSHNTVQQHSVEDISKTIYTDLNTTQNFLKFAYNQHYIDRESINTIDNNGITYLYAITERGRSFLHHLQEYDEMKEKLTSIWQPETQQRSVFKQVITTIQILRHQSQALSRQDIFERINVNISAELFPLLVKLGILNTQQDFTVTRNPRLLYSINPQAPQALFDLIDKHQILKAKLIHEHMLTWKKSDGSPVKFY